MAESTTKSDYKDSINLPKTTLEMRANAAQKEPLTQNSGKIIKFMKKVLNKEIK